MQVEAGNTEPPTGILQIAPKKTSRINDRDTFMRFLSYAYRISSNFVFLALVYYSLNFPEKYQQRAIVAILVLIYAAMRAASALRSFYFFQRIERLELEARRLATLTGDGPAASAARKQIVNDVATLRHGGEMKSYIDLLFLTLIVVLCISKIVTSWTVRRQSRSLRFDRHRDSARGACVDRNQLRETFCFALVRDR